MFEFKWRIADEQAADVVLRVYSRNGWFGRKVLVAFGDEIYRRGRFGGIEARFFHASTGEQLQLRFVKDSEQSDWRPALYRDGQEVPVEAGDKPPHIPPRPKVISVVTGLTYLVMLMAAIMLPSIVKILDAVKLQHDDRKYVFTVEDAEAPEDMLRFGPQQLAEATVDEPYTAQLQATGGTPPYTWEASAADWPRDMVLDASTGEISFTPNSPHDKVAVVTVTDAEGYIAEGAFKVTVRRKGSRPKGWPTIVTESLPPATCGVSYEEKLAVEGGEPPLKWFKSTGPLPEGVAFVNSTGTILGTPEPLSKFTIEAQYEKDLSGDEVPEELGKVFVDGGIVLSPFARIAPAPEASGWMITDGVRRFQIEKREAKLHVLTCAGQYPISIRVEDSAYTVTQDIMPWIVPFVVTAVCLLGFWNMRRWGVVLFGVLIAVQLVLNLIGAASLPDWLTWKGLVPVSSTALALEAFVFVVGLLHVQRMK